MAYVGFERVASGLIKTVAELTIPANANGAEIQADTQDVRYTMDGSTVPTASSGMLFLTTEPPKYFDITELRNIKFIQGAGGVGAINIHYHTALDV